MSSRILTPTVVGIDAFMRDPRGALSHAEGGTVAVFADNAPAFYAITPERLATLLELEARLARPASDVTLDTQFYEEPAAVPVAVPMGKFAMYAGWKPDDDFIRLAGLWGIALTQPVTPEELAAFVAYWQAEGKVFHHVQWQQKLARSVQIGRAGNGGQPKRDINAFSQPDREIPQGFRGAK
ncbi:primosomal protein DnaT [Pseudenterobacter timonensis]|uniref:primosomal protein DnaT n=1 Tax=Pseudenterobacter timonensis TaxID=1755099 RepID=UPI00077B7EB0|nr:primosomal protein DnaT [Pseudenterobacter timonensis]